MSGLSAWSMSEEYRRRKSETLIRWWHIFNQWEWPKDYPYPCPFKDSLMQHGDVVNIHMEAIERALGRKAIFQNRTNGRGA